MGNVPGGNTLKLPVTDLSSSIVTVIGFADPVASPLHSVNPYVALGVAVKVTTVPWVYFPPVQFGAGFVPTVVHALRLHILLASGMTALILLLAFARLMPAPRTETA